MAEKEATVYILDVGSSTRKCHNGRIESDLDYGMSYIWDKIGTTLAANRVGLAVGVVGFRTDKTRNKLAEKDEAYNNIAVFKELGPIELSHLNDLKEKIVPSETEYGDAISAIVVGIEMIDTFTTLKSGKPGKFSRKIVLLTDGQGQTDDGLLDAIADKLKESGILLVVLGIDFDDAEFGFKEEDKSSTKRNSENTLKQLTEGCNGTFATAAEVLEHLAVPDVKAVRPYSTYEGRLSLGDYEKYPETAMFIDVKRCFRAKLAKPVSASSYVSGNAANGESSSKFTGTIGVDTEMTDAPSNDLSAVRSVREYKIYDPSAQFGKRTVPRDELEKGYEYGRTAVHISAAEENVTKLETIKSFSIIGFIPSDKYERYLNMGESCITFAPSTNDKARMALSSLIHALFELDSYAVARIVVKDNKDPQIILLAPSIEPDLEALIDVPLPFAEDVRIYRFPPLDKVITSSGAILTQHRNIPSDNLLKSMSDYVDSMDLSTFGKDEEGNDVEYMKIDETFNPTIHRINQAIKQRAIHPEQPIAPIADVLKKWSTIPSELKSRSDTCLKQLVATADVKPVPPKTKSKRGRRETIKPLSGLDVDSILNSEDRSKVTAKNTIPEFKTLIRDPENDVAIGDATKQMSGIIFGKLRSSSGDHLYGQAMADMAAFRHEVIELEMPQLYNTFIRDLKSKILNEELGEDRTTFWLMLKSHNLGLIDQMAYEYSDITIEEAREFYSIKPGLPTRAK